MDITSTIVGYVLIINQEIHQNQILIVLIYGLVFMIKENVFGGHRCYRVE